MSNQYETVFILTPVLSEVQMKEAVKKFRKVLTDNGAEIIHEEDWGLRKLAYPIRKMSNGFYNLIEFTGESKIIDTLEIAYRRDERVIRFLTTRMEKYAVEWAVKKRSGKKPVIADDEPVNVINEKEE
ncbi:MAG: 30S ribosomal protein S6 [Bacteroidia bacterium]|nr:30S ribosomal protein S6 [Bacteroidia bacterium]